jgi:replicative DNA helicase
MRSEIEDLRLQQEREIQDIREEYEQQLQELQSSDKTSEIEEDQQEIVTVQQKAELLDQATDCQIITIE